MTPPNITTSERAFEEAIEGYLVSKSGYEKVENTQFDRELAVDKITLLNFLKQTQKDTWDALVAAYGQGVDELVVKRILSECDNRGMLDVIRNGVRDRGQLIRVAFFRPPTNLNVEAHELYSKNKLTVMRQVYYDQTSEKSIDMLLSLNGLPIATVELKNAFTGQTTINAIKQYIKDRKPTNKTPLIAYKKRALVHFAVDTDEVFMATKLVGKSTFFLPFNKGSNGGKGNPDDHNHVTGYKTGYLWEDIWQRDSWLDIIHRYIHLQVDEQLDYQTGKKIKKETLIFPRYHQLSATRSLLEDAKSNGAGNNYLIQHSAGSGKTNTISWTAHQLASLHNKNNEPVFNSVVVVSDRKNLDRQLQDNIYQIEHKHGVVAKIDEDKSSSDLAEELNKGTKIIITTLQKFSFLMGKVKDFSEKKFAVIVDEAHSSQSGRAAGNLRGVLGGSLGDQTKNEEEVLEQTAKEESAEEAKEQSLEDLVIAVAQSRGQQKNISFFAFTATPKAKTLEMFGQKGEDGKPRPFHLYSMRQAIDEKFIHDVLKNYTTYKTYYKLSKAIEDDPEIDEKKAKKAIARFMSLHPYNIAQKTEIMIEHFRQFTSKKINGRAKAMVVTRSRLHAVRYKQEFDKYIKAKGYKDLKTLVAFSGKVFDPQLPDHDFTESGMNEIGERELPDRFGSKDYQVLIVAEKYQTGFDQPLLHTMFVDKKLGDLKAVQTLSRLNRTTSGKVDTFVLDFENTIDEIKEAFKPYYQQTEVEEPTDPNILYNLDTKLRAKPILRPEDIDGFAKVYFKPINEQTQRDHGQLNRFIDPAVSRFNSEYLETNSDGEEVVSDDGEEFKSDLQSFVRLYSFLSQVIAWQDAELEKLYAYGRYLLTKLPYRSSGGKLELDDEVELTYYRNEKTFQGSGALLVGDTSTVKGPTEVGTGRGGDSTKVPLSSIIEVINDRFGTEWTDEDKLLFEQIAGDMVADPKLSEQARANTKEQFKHVFESGVLDAFMERQDRNEKIVTDFMSNPDLRGLIISALLDEVYTKAREDKT